MEYDRLSREQLVEAVGELHRRLTELEERSRRLQDEVSWLQGCIRGRTRELSERVKELDCLYGVSALLERRGVPWEAVVERAVALIPRGWQHPALACARAELRGKEFRTPNFRRTPWLLGCDVRVGGRRAGRLEVGYLRRPAGDKEPFLKEERALIGELARRLGEVVELKELEAGALRAGGLFSDLLSRLRGYLKLPSPRQGRGPG